MLTTKDFEATAFSLEDFLKSHGRSGFPPKVSEGIFPKANPINLERVANTAATAITADDFVVKGATAQDIADLNTSLAYLETSANALKIIQGMKANKVAIEIIHNGDDHYSPDSNTIAWDPHSALTVQDNATGQAVGVQSAALGLAHEGAHSTDPDLATHSGTLNAQYDNDAEKYAVAKEDLIATDLGETLRYNHLGFGLPNEVNPTEHSTPKGDGTYTYAEWSGGKIITGDTYQMGMSPANLPDVSAGQTLAARTLSNLISAMGAFEPQAAVVSHLSAINDSHATLQLAVGR
ncbi:hypothetical protein Bsp3421_002000 [Burkholderia sp. FERM BP-3421]|uniref:hypothetical protein n=1 Tax=Burkholderia sp. FERM BP-3421 TaxID=1494466 RepID=UPI0023624171|nr:hypothetical protein [Burkholderia sp. FERM BP-3421]WDD92030.1 hypothetical protein Bsp3421_002000 [Burkholderia sp. FERM BP-3421]